MELDDFRKAFDDWLDEHADWPLEWQDAASTSDYSVHVSPARLAAFNDEFAALVERYRRSAGDPDEEAVEVHLHAFPLPDDHP